MHNIYIVESSRLEGACWTCNLWENTNSHHTFHPIINMICFLSKILCFLSIVTIDYYIVNLPFIMFFIMDSFLGLLNSRALLILRAHSVLLGFYSILGVLVPWKCYRAQKIWFILCLVIFKISTNIYMLLVDATLDGETPHGFYIIKLNLTSCLKCGFY